jgi:hypothetical protein
MGLFYNADEVIATDQLNRRNVLYAAGGSALVTYLANAGESYAPLAALTVGSLVAATYWSLAQIRNPEVMNLYDMPIQVKTMAELLKNADGFIYQDLKDPFMYRNNIGNYYYPSDKELDEARASHVTVATVGGTPFSNV